MKSFITALLLSLTLLLTGCVGNPQVSEKGEQIVWISSIKIIGNDGVEVVVPLNASIASTLVASVLGTMAHNANAGKYYIGYSPDHSRVGKIIFRSPWPGAEELKPNTWAILSEDKNGRILLPCNGCKPADAVN